MIRRLLNVFLKKPHIIYKKPEEFIGPLEKVDKELVENMITELEAKFKTNYHDPNWLSLGYHATDQFLDTWDNRIVLFSSISVFLLTFFFLAIFFPNSRAREWVQREAYIELERREKFGLPLIDPNFAPIEEIDLPPEDELIDFKFII